MSVMSFTRRISVAVVLFCAASQPLLGDTFAERMAACLGCHGENGQSPHPVVPSLGGQPAPYLLIQLYLFRENQRASTYKKRRSHGRDHVRDDERVSPTTISARFQNFFPSCRRLPVPRMQADLFACRRSRADHENRCNSCHNLDLTGRESIPHIANQREDFLVKTTSRISRQYPARLRWRHGSVLAPVDDAQIADLAYYIARFR